MYLVLNFKSNSDAYGHNKLAYERDARGSNLHPGVNLHPGANFLQIVHMNTALKDETDETPKKSSPEPVGRFHELRYVTSGTPAHHFVQMMALCLP